MSRSTTHTRGVVFIHSATTAMCPHVTWALEGVLGAPVRLDWINQPAGPALLRTDYSWSAPVGTGAKLASALRGWENVRYEITEEPSAGVDGSRWSHTPRLGIHHAWINAIGEVVINESRLRTVLDQAAGDPRAVQSGLDHLMGGPWDLELEPFRYAGDGAPVRWLHKVG